MAYVIWLTGISGSGKTTLGELIVKEFEQKQENIEFLDGNIVRDFFENDLGYTRQERIFNVKRIAFAATLLAQNSVNVVVSNIAPYYEVRDFIRKHTENYIQIFLKTSLEDIKKRDVHGHYKKYENGLLKNLIGIDDPYDIPRTPDLVVDTTAQTPEESLAKIMDLLVKKGVVI